MIDQKMEVFQAEFNSLKNSDSRKRFEMEKENIYMCLDDKTKKTPFDRHYVYHTAWAARILNRTKPASHVDISSYLYFATLVSAFIPVSFYDYRPARLELDNLTSEHADITALPFEDNSIQSLSCMHVVEHIGLARYGDPLDYDGDLKAIAELKRVLAKDGNLLFVVPIGNKAQIQFNAHRIYTKAQILDYFSDFELKEFALIQDRTQAGIIVDPDEETLNKEVYGCGCFWFSGANS